MEAAALVALVLAAIPAVLCGRNLRLYQPPPEPDPRQQRPKVSVLIPARNEEHAIGQALQAVCAATAAELEVIVMDDHSDDGTAAVVRQFAARDARVRLEKAPPLPDGWNGKQHACRALAQASRHPVMLFMDADVRLAPDAIARMAAFLQASGCALASGFPLQQTGSFMEMLVVPLIHFLFLGYLPISRMRQSTSPAYAAGCGQLFIARREAYDQAGGHGAIKNSMHDGIKLPRAFRRAGLPTDLFDAGPLATCRMYGSGRQVWQGFSKNATEGMAAPAAILPWTVLLLGGQVLPFGLLLAVFIFPASKLSAACALAGSALGYATRLRLAARFRQSLPGVLLHPLGVLMVLAIQWLALLRHVTGRAPSWKGRKQPTTL